MPLRRRHCHMLLRYDIVSYIPPDDMLLLIAYLLDAAALLR